MGEAEGLCLGKDFLHRREPTSRGRPRSSVQCPAGHLAGTPGNPNPNPDTRCKPAGGALGCQVKGGGKKKDLTPCRWG